LVLAAVFIALGGAVIAWLVAGDNLLLERTIVYWLMSGTNLV
jgi:hypothetical protein